MPTSLPLIEQSRFKKHLKQLLQAGRFTKADFQQVLAYLQTSTPLPEKYDDHVIKNASQIALCSSRVIGCSFIGLNQMRSA